MEKGSAALASEPSRSLFSINRIGKALKIKDIKKRTPIMIRIVSKSVSGIGGGEGS
jgi:hypothetical protein